MLEVDGNQVRSSSGSCRSRRRETFSHRSSFEWEEGLRDIKPRGDQSFSVLDDYFQGHFPTRNHTISTMKSASRVKSQTQIDLLHSELKRNSIKKSNRGVSIRSLINEEMSKNANSRKLSTSLIAKLMGLDPLPAQNLSSTQKISPFHFQDRSSEEFKDVYEVLESKKSPIRKRSPSKSGRRDDLKRIQGTHEHSEEQRDSQPFEDPFLMLLHEPSSLFANQIVVLKSSSDVQKTNRRARPRCEDDDLLTHCIKEHALSLSGKKPNPKQRKTKRETIPTRIVVLKPSLDEVWDDTAESDYDSSSRRESRRYCPREILSESRERKKLSGNSSMGIAREMTENMACKYGTAKSLLSREARKRLSERWKTANRSPEIGAHRRSSGATLMEMLSSSEREFPVVKNSGGLITREEILARWGSSLGISDCRSIRGRRGRLNCPSSGSMKSSDGSFSPRDSRHFIESFGDHRELEIAIDLAEEKSVVVEEVPRLTEDPLFDCRPLAGQDLLEDSYATEEEGLSDKRETRGKNCSSSVEVAEHYSPVSVLDPPDERETSLDRFDRIKVNLQELLPVPENQHSKTDIEDAEAEEIRLTFEDEENLEFCYLLDILIDSGLYKADRDTLLAACFTLESPVDPRVFENLESIYKQLTWAGMSRKLLFDVVNSILAEISDSLARPSSGKVNAPRDSKQLVEEVWELLLKKSAIYESCLSKTQLDEMTWRGEEVDLDGVAVDIENMLNEDLLEELVAEVGPL